jgi:CBS domain-containing protein
LIKCSGQEQIFNSLTDFNPNGETMKVQELMTKDVKTCGRDSNLAEVAGRLWDGDCGALPVVDDESKVIGMISDRDICFAVATKGRLAAEISAGELIAGKPLFTCTTDDDVQNALSTMQQRQVRRIPVVNTEGRIEGILSISDVVLAASTDAQGIKQGVSSNEAISTLKGICEQRHATQQAAAAASGGAAQA